MGPTARYALRCLLWGIAAANSSLITVAVAGDPITANAGIVALLLGVGATLTYAGIGAAIPQVEPNIGNVLEDELLES